MGGQRCKTCGHAKLPDIHRLRHGGATHEALAAEFDLSPSSLWRHFRDDHPVTGFAAVACAPEAVQAAAAVAGRLGAPDRPPPAYPPPMRHRAIAGGPRPVKPASILGLHTSDNDPGSPAAASIMPFPAPPAAPVVQSHKSPIPTDATELSLLASFGATDQHLADLVGCRVDDVSGIIGEHRGGDSALFDTSSQQWAKHFVRIAMEELIGLRRRRRDALDGKRWREADRFDPKIAKASNDLFLTLQRFGLVGPIPPEKLSKRGRDADEIWEMIRGVAQGRMPPELTPEEELRFLGAEQSAVA